MHMLYSYEGQYPAPLPERIRLEDGSTRTDSTTFTESELKEWGFTGPITLPQLDPNTSECIWNSETKDFEIRQFTEAELSARVLQEARSNVDFRILYDELLRSNTYQTIREQAKLELSLTVSCTELVTTLIEAKLGRPNFELLESCIQNVLTTAQISATEVAEIYQILADSKLLSAVNIAALEGYVPPSPEK